MKVAFPLYYMTTLFYRQTGDACRDLMDGVIEFYKVTSN